MAPKLKVLVVDDNPDIVASTLGFLRLEGYEPSSCAHGNDVPAQMEAFDPDVVLLDISLPGKNGWDVAREIRQHHNRKRPTLIAITGEYTKEAGTPLAETSGFDYFIVKPADPRVLLQLLAAARQLISARL